ncbi:MAG: hypothetical protein V1816_24840, partial [Pseudomonadota bacterium]
FNSPKYFGMPVRKIIAPLDLAKKFVFCNWLLGYNYDKSLAVKRRFLFGAPRRRGKAKCHPRF